MTFESEERMKSTAINAFDNELLDEPFTRLDEFEYANGRCDLVYAKESEAYLERRFKELGISSHMLNDHQLMTFLHLKSRGEISKNYLMEIGALEEGKKRAALESLIEKNFIVKVQGGKLRTAHNLRRHVLESYSIELKLENWKRALEQAIRSKSYSEYQYVALPESAILPAQDHIEEFISSNVGLIEIFEDAEFYIHHEPNQEDPYSPINQWRLNEKTILGRLSAPA